MTKTFSVRLPDETFSKLEADAARLGLKPAVLARAYIKMAVERRSDVMSVAELLAEPSPSNDAPARQSRSRRKKNK